jgi:putative membrane protein
VGIAGLMWQNTRATLIPMSPWIILISFLITISFHRPFSPKLILLLAGVGVCGFFVEYAGVTTGWIFGHYQYGKSLGPAWHGVPFIIGITWCSLTYYTAQFKPGKTSNILLISTYSALLMTVYDLLLEPTAIKFDFWHWKNNTIPMQNYIAWFVIAFLFQLVLRRSGVPWKNKFAGSVFIIQLVFFAVLAILPVLF